MEQLQSQFKHCWGCKLNKRPNTYINSINFHLLIGWPNVLYNPTNNIILKTTFTSSNLVVTLH